MKERETGNHTIQELRERFNKIDADDSGKIEASEYIRFSLRDALARSAARVLDLFKVECLFQPDMSHHDPGG